MEIRDNEFDIIDNEFDIPEPNPLDNIGSFIGIGNAQFFLDENYREATKPMMRKVGAFVLTFLKDANSFRSLAGFYGHAYKVRL
jgi:hypothetical protein